jgi:hypothetical protein
LSQSAQISRLTRYGTGQSTVAINGAPAWALSAAIFTLGLTPLGTGSSSLANELARTQQILPFDRSARKTSFFDSVSDYAADDWDGDGARAILSQDVLSARALLNVLGVPEPEIAAGSDGSVCMEWIRQSPTGEKKIYVDVGPGGRVLTFARFGAFSPIEKHFDQYGPDVDNHLRVLFSIYLA